MTTKDYRDNVDGCMTRDSVFLKSPIEGLLFSVFPFIQAKWNLVSVSERAKDFWLAFHVKHLTNSAHSPASRSNNII
jgi:hypothetical protein